MQSIEIRKNHSLGSSEEYLCEGLDDTSGLTLIALVKLVRQFHVIDFLVFVLYSSVSIVFSVFNDYGTCILLSG